MLRLLILTDYNQPKSWKKHPRIVKGKFLKLKLKS